MGNGASDDWLRLRIDTAITNYPDQRVTLRDCIQVIREHARRGGTAPTPVSTQPLAQCIELCARLYDQNSLPIIRSIEQRPAPRKKIAA